MKPTLVKSNLLLVTALFTCLWSLVHVLPVEANPLNQSAQLEPVIGPVRCNYELLLPGGPRAFNPDKERLIQQETDTRVSCTFEATIPSDSSLVVRSSLQSWSGTVKVNAPGRVPLEADVHGPEDVVDIIGGTIVVDLTGKTPRGVRQERDVYGYERELHWAQSFNLIGIDIRPPSGPDFGVEQKNVQSASLGYIQAKDALEEDRDNAPEDVRELAQQLLDEGFPDFSLRILEIDENGLPWWLVGFIGLIVGIALVGFPSVLILMRRRRPHVDGGDHFQPPDFQSPDS